MKKHPIKILAFDADDTLWVNEPFYRKAEQQLVEMLRLYENGEALMERLYAREIENLKIFGYGAKGFALSMIETAIELTNGQISGKEIQRIVELGKGLLKQPIELLPGVHKTIDSLSQNYELMLITKGDLFDQESKIARSGLADFFKHIEIVSEKNIDAYQKVLEKYRIDPKTILMIGNSLKSDVLPIVQLGGSAVHIPYHTTWVHERVSEQEQGQHVYKTLASISELPQLLQRMTT